MSSREEFEELVVDNGGYVDRKASGEYFERDVALAWLAWKAATERAEEICQNEMDEQFIDSDAWYAARSCRDAIREGSE